MSITDDTQTLEKHLVVVGDWIKAHPTAQKTAKTLTEEYGGNIGIGHCKEIGWFVLHDQGYGIGLIWKEKDGNSS